MSSWMSFKRVGAGSQSIPGTYLLTRCGVGKDGRKPVESIKAKMARAQGMEFGEGLWWKRRREGGRLGKLTVMWEDGVCVCVCASA